MAEVNFRLRAAIQTLHERVEENNRRAEEMYREKALGKSWVRYYYEGLAVTKVEERLMREVGEL